VNTGDARSADAAESVDETRVRKYFADAIFEVFADEDEDTDAETTSLLWSLRTRNAEPKFQDPHISSRYVTVIEYAIYVNTKLNSLVWNNCVQIFRKGVCFLYCIRCWQRSFYIFIGIIVRFLK